MEYENELSKLIDQLNRSAKESKTGEKPSLDQLLATAVKRNASDIILAAGCPVTLRINGGLIPESGPVTSAEDIRNLLTPMLTTDQQDELQNNKSLDFCFLRAGIGRFRANFHHQRGTLAAAIGLLPMNIPSLESLHLPATLSLLSERRQGLVLVTGATGCGKT